MTTHGLCMVIISLFGTAVLALAEATLNLLHLALIVVLLLCDTTSILHPAKLAPLYSRALSRNVCLCHRTDYVQGWGRHARQTMKVVVAIATLVRQRGGCRKETLTVCTQRPFSTCWKQVREH